MKRLLPLVLFSMLSLIVRASESLPNSADTQKSQGDTVIACGHPDYPPWNWRKGNKIVGACAEVTEMLFETLGIKVDNKFSGPWKRCQGAVEQGTVDVNICAFINDQRKSYSTFIETPMALS